MDKTQGVDFSHIVCKRGDVVLVAFKEIVHPDLRKEVRERLAKLKEDAGVQVVALEGVRKPICIINEASAAPDEVRDADPMDTLLDEIRALRAEVVKINSRLLANEALDA